MYGRVGIGIQTLKSKLKVFLFFCVHILKSTPHIVSFLVAQNALELVKPIAMKLQKKDQNVVQSYNMIDHTVDNVKKLRRSISSDFHDWFIDATRLASETGSEIHIAGRQIYHTNAGAASPEDY